MNTPTPIIAGNWKMNKGPDETRQFFEDFCRAYPARNDRSVWFFPPAVAITAAVAAVRGRADLLIGVQNIHWEAAGAFTGETSALMATQAGARIALVGHSERRHVFGETDLEVGRKVAAALGVGLEVVVCVGETLEEREAGRLEEVLGRQIAAALEHVDSENGSHLSIAYEPVWAIGTGVNATPADAASAHAFARHCVEQGLDRTAASTMPVLYGGSVKPENAAALLAASDVDGLLVGGASLNPEPFARIAAVQAAD